MHGWKELFLEVPHSQIRKCETVACWGSEAAGDSDGWGCLMNLNADVSFVLFALNRFRMRKIKHMQNIYAKYIKMKLSMNFTVLFVFF